MSKDNKKEHHKWLLIGIVCILVLGFILYLFIDKLLPQGESSQLGGTGKPILSRKLEMDALSNKIARCNQLLDSVM